MSQLTSPADIKKLGRVLSVWAHPDDETFSSAGIIATAAQNGQFTACVTFTKGESGVQDARRWPPAELGRIREEELHTALHILGCRNHHILDYADGGLADVPDEEGARAISEYIKQYRPETILTFGPEGMTGHPDHQTVSHWVSLAVNGLEDKPTVYHAVELQERYDTYMKELDKMFNIYFNIDRPPLKNRAECDIYYDLPENICRTKCRALAAMPSQTEKMMKELGDRAQKVFAVESFVRAK